MNLQFKVTEQELKRIDTNKPADLSNKYLKCQFTFNNEWENFIKFAIFRTKENNYRVTIQDNECYVPFDVLAEQKFRMTVYGVNDDVRITTNLLWISLVGSGFVTEYDESGEFNPDMTEQIWEAMSEKADKSELNNKADKTYVDSELTIRDEQISLKANKGYVDEQLGLKADTSYVDTELSQRDTEINLKANKTYVDSELMRRAYKSYVDSELLERDTLIGQKADKAYVNYLVNLKADKEYVDSELDLKSDKLYVNNKLSEKVDKVTGKGLSTNDFTNHYKNFLDGFDGDIEAFLLEHKEEIEALITDEVLAVKADKTYVDELIHRVDNKFIVKSDKEIISTGEDTDIVAKIKEDGFPVASTMIHFFEKISPVIRLFSSSQIIETGDTSEVYARVRDDDGSLAQNMKVHFFEKITPAIKLSASQPILETGDDLDVYAKVYDTDGSLVQNTKAHFYRSIFADVYDKGEGNYYLSSNYLTQTVTEDGVLITDNHPDTAIDDAWYRVSLPPNIYPSDMADLDSLCAFSTNKKYYIELDIIDSTDTSQMIVLRPHIQGADAPCHEQTLSELSNNNSFHLKIEVINGVSYWYVDNNPTPVYVEDSIDLGDAFAFRIGIHKQQSLKFNNLIIYKI